MQPPWFCHLRFAWQSTSEILACSLKESAIKWKMPVFSFALKSLQLRTVEACKFSLKCQLLSQNVCAIFLAEKTSNANLKMRTNLNNKFAQSCHEFKANSNSNELYFQLRKPSESFEAWDKINFPGLSLIPSDLQCSFTISKASGGESGREISSSVRQAIKTGIFKRVKHQ